MGKLAFEAGKMKFNAGKVAFDAGKMKFKAGKVAFETGKMKFNWGKLAFEAGTVASDAGIAPEKTGIKDFEKTLAILRKSLNGSPHSKVSF